MNVVWDTMESVPQLLSDLTGAEISGVRLFATLLYVYPLMIFQRIFLTGVNPNILHLYYTLTGAFLMYFNFGTASAMFFINIVIMYILMVLLGSSKYAVILSFTINLTYLCYGYISSSLMDEIQYVVDWTTPHCVLTLKLIGLSWDVYDGGQKDKKGKEDSALSEVPSLLEMLGFSYYTPGMLTGPQISFLKYKRFVQEFIIMSSSRRLSDVIGMVRGLQKVTTSFTENQYKSIDKYWRNSSLNHLPGKVGEGLEQTVSSMMVKQAEIQDKVAEKLASIKPVTDTKSPGATGSSTESETDKMERVNRLIPPELQMPPVTEADLADLARDIESLGYMSGERTTVLKHESDSSPPSTVITPVQTEVKSADNKIYATGNDVTKPKLPAQPNPLMPTPHPKPIRHQLSSKSKESKVPANRISRIMSFGSLAAGLGVGAVAEITRRGLGLSDGGKTSTDDGTGALLGSSPFLSDANMERIISTLCRVRGAALKLGQMLSIQDNSMLNPQLQAAFERVRQSADFMPLSQMESAMSAQLGADWRSKFAEFDDKPFAAASIGQVHRAVLHSGEVVAVKVQYPGVAKSINSDINNLLSILKVWQILPKGMYAENLMDVSRHELAWECDYRREARCMKVFRELLKDDDHFFVPQVYEELSTDQVLVTELIPGVPLDKCTDLSQETRDKLGKEFLRLCVTELYEWNIMQTDPNWSNFFYNSSNGKVYLLDFGATRAFNRNFIDVYIDIIKAAAVQDRETILSKSLDLGFLTGYESKPMVEAHIDAVSVLGGPCGKDEMFDFSQQDITKRVENIIPVMLKHRLGPPPEETYSLHRKLSGAFLLCAKLKSRVNVKQLYDPIFANYQYGLPDRQYGIDDQPVK